MAEARKFTLAPAAGSRRKELHLFDPVFDEPLYTIDTNGSSDTAIVQNAKDNKPVGTVTATTSTGHASFTVTGLKDVPSAVIRMTNLSRMTRMNHFSFDIKTPAFLEQKLEWKPTKDVPLWAGKGDAVHMKLVYAGTRNAIARFIHKPATVHVIEGTLEIFEDHGPAWDLTVFESCLAVLKYGSLMLRLKPT